MTLSVNGKLGGFSFHGVAQTPSSTGNNPELVWMKNSAICCSLHTLVCWWSHLKTRQLASSTDFKDRKPLLLQLSPKTDVYFHYSNSCKYRWSRKTCKSFTVVLQTLHLFILYILLLFPSPVTALILRWTVINMVFRCSSAFLRESVYLLLSRFHPGDTDCVTFTGSCLCSVIHNETKDNSEEEFRVTASIQPTAGGGAARERVTFDTHNLSLCCGWSESVCISLLLLKGFLFFSFHGWEIPLKLNLMKRHLSSSGEAVTLFPLNL